MLKKHRIILNTRKSQFFRNISSVGSLAAASTGIPPLLRHFKVNSVPAVVQRAMFNFDSILLQAAAPTMARPPTMPHAFPTSSSLAKVDHQSPPMKVAFIELINGLGKKKRETDRKVALSKQLPVLDPERLFC